MSKRVGRKSFCQAKLTQPHDASDLLLYVLKLCAKVECLTRCEHLTAANTRNRVVSGTKMQ